MDIRVVITLNLPELVGIILTLLTGFFHIGYRLGKVELKVNTMWEFQMRRAFAEGVGQDLMTHNSPWTWRPETLAWFDPIADEMRAYYAKNEGLRKLNEADLALEIERQWGEWILHNICVPHGIEGGACLLAAVSVMKRTTSDEQ